MADATMPGDVGGEGYGLDLNPDFLSGQNKGLVGPHPEKADNVRTAYDIKGLHDRLNEFEDDELKGIPVLPPGTPLEQGATYIDLREREPRELTGMGGMEAGSNNWYVPKSEVDYVVWNRLTGVTNPERLDQADEGSTARASQSKVQGRGAKRAAGNAETPPRTRRRASASSAAGNASGPVNELGAAGNAGGSPDEPAPFVAGPEGIPETESGATPKSQSYGNELH